MDPTILSALVGLVGGLAGVVIGSNLQKRFGYDQLRRQLTLSLYDRYDDQDLLESRIQADRLLFNNSNSPTPKSFSELYNYLPSDSWGHISRTRHFLDQIGLMKRLDYLDNDIAEPAFADHVSYWIDRYFDNIERLERIFCEREGKEPMEWRVSCDELKQLFLSPNKRRRCICTLPDEHDKKPS
ncbi:hypothetical protein KG088_17795 [Halomonas sp. TRM85114]|uniref:hypothetical protein n=1 Tax=Halomonas jincaotanensis TaxID=2810616 RepID=UPI001BD604B2|nr:hypothetical protein [Halomonas jincaotanensis]MBS9405460.1 hypothetical protein [Halomonas jincaotanensis]